MKKINLPLLLILILIFFPLHSCFSNADNVTIVNFTTSPYLYLDNWKYCAGDNPDWCKKVFNDNLWESTPRLSNIDSDSSIIWFRKHIVIKGRQDETEISALSFLGLAKAYEIYWDGILVGKNGFITEYPQNKISGSIKKYLKLKPQHIKPGFHILALRVLNNFPDYHMSHNNVFFSYYSTFVRITHDKIFILAFMSGFNFLVVLLSISLFLIGEKQRSYLYFGLYRLCYMIFAVLEIAIIRYSITMSYHDIIIIAQYILDPIAYVFLSLYILFNFDLPKKLIHFSLNFIFFILFYFLWGSSFTMLLLLYPIGMIIWAIKNHKPGSVLAFIGLAILSITSFLTFFNLGWYEMIGGNIAFVCFALLSISRQVRAQQQAYHASLLKSTQLESQLLKKNIQPHFLMNTLLTIISLIKKNPDKAIKLIQALAAEFRMIMKISSAREIFIKDEITICQKHLELMGFRRKANYRLVTTGISPDNKIPPMIFHTLIENGLTHAYEACENGTFYLTCEMDKKNIRYILKNDGSRIKELKLLDNKQIEEGMGMRYVKARLDEKYPGDWEISYGQHNNFWQVDIKIKTNGTNNCESTLCES